MVAFNVMDCSAIKGSKGDQMWQQTEQWMVQLRPSLAIEGSKGAVCSAMHGPAIS